MNTKLANRIEARNRSNAVANMLMPRIFAACAPFVGQKIKTATGDRTVKFKNALVAIGLPSQENTSDRSSVTHCWVSGRYDLTVTVRVTLFVSGKNYDAETIIYVGVIEGATLVRLNAPPKDFRTDFNADEIETARQAVLHARELMHTAESALCGFGEHDPF